MSIRTEFASPAFPSYLGKLALLLGLITLATGCGRIECKTNRDNFYAETRSSNELGVIHFKDDMNSDPYYSMSIKKISRGYALHAPLYNDDSTGARFTLQHDKDLKTFSGLQFSFNF